MPYTMDIIDRLEDLIAKSGLSKAEIARRGGIRYTRLTWLLRPDMNQRSIRNALETLTSALKVIQDERPDLVKESETFRFVPSNGESKRSDSES